MTSQYTESRFEHRSLAPEPLLLAIYFYYYSHLTFLCLLSLPTNQLILCSGYYTHSFIRRLYFTASATDFSPSISLCSYSHWQLIFSLSLEFQSKFQKKKNLIVSIRKSHYSKLPPFSIFGCPQVRWLSILTVHCYVISCSKTKVA